MRYVLEEYGLMAPSEADMYKWIGPPLHRNFAGFKPDIFQGDELQTAVDMYRARFAKVGKYEYKLYSGIDRLLTDLKHDGRRLAVTTSKATHVARDLVTLLQIAQYFDVVLGSVADGSKATKVEILEVAWRDLGKPAKQEMVMVGDREFDIEGAREIGIYSVGVLWGYGSLEELKSAGADVIVGRMDELAQVLGL
jgi:phosphoglycolate phosphatase